MTSNYNLSQFSPKGATTFDTLQYHPPCYCDRNYICLTYSPLYFFYQKSVHKRFTINSPCTKKMFYPKAFSLHFPSCIFFRFHGIYWNWVVHFILNKLGKQVPTASRPFEVSVFTTSFDFVSQFQKPCVCIPVSSFKPIHRVCTASLYENSRPDEAVVYGWLSPPPPLLPLPHSSLESLWVEPPSRFQWRNWTKSRDLSHRIQTWLFISSPL